MSTAGPSVSAETVRSLFKKYAEAKTDEEKMEVVESANSNLTGAQMKIFSKEVKKHETALKANEVEEDAESSSGVKINTPAATEKSKGSEEAAAGTKEVAVEPKELLQFWTDLEAMSGEELVSEQVINDFQYVGFNPNKILESIITKGKAAKRNKNEILSDIAEMCTIAMIKGSITQKNLKKLSDTGKKSYSVLEARYGLKKGGSKGVDPDVITIARVGAAFPGSMMKILIQKPTLGKTFTGSFGSKNLPSYLRHQCAAACIPETLDDKVKNFLLGLITAYTSDQSKVISKENKAIAAKKPSEIYEDQENFVMTTHGSNYPSLAVRIQIFKSWTLTADFRSLKLVGDNIIKIMPDFVLISEEELKKAVPLV
jgi:hypothetical protein